MASIPTLEGIRSSFVQTSRLRQHVLRSGKEDAIPVLFIHGNASSSTFWEESMLALPEAFQGIAPDLRGYGDTEDLIVDATRGFGDWVEDLLELKAALGISRYHVAGHSLGGSLLYSLINADSENILSVTLLAPGSPFGFGGTTDEKGTPAYADFAGSGGGAVNPEFPKLMAAGDRSSDNQASPRVVMNAFYWKPPFIPAREEALLSSVMSEKVGPERYPGDMAPSENWPNVAPGKYGPANALSPKYVGDTVDKFLNLAAKPSILWVRGADDQIVSDMSMFDFGTLGKLGAVPGWPGEEVMPPQPMVGQTRYVLETYQAKGGQYQELVFENCGHSPQIEKPEAFMEALIKHLKENS
ncbi:MAG: alpha/beta fold hydrolase [Trueperaceae bacterium]|nr:alpha/beta fold hydrolase [Trueperaceae bacterium]